jgi:hypothetical protein
MQLLRFKVQGSRFKGSRFKGSRFKGSRFRRRLGAEDEEGAKRRQTVWR